MAVKAKLRPPQVFINFRGAELRDNFVNHLVRALREGEINVFIDVHELKGRKLRHLFTRIKKSKIALAIFSKRYCESKWCLDELVKMNDQMREGTLVVIPIFYNVTANDVKRAGNLDRETEFNGEEEDFTILFKEMKKKYAIDRVKRWELSLKSVTERMGLSTEVYGNFLVKSIVREVRRHLGMPLEKPLSDGDVAFTALWVSSVFSFFIAPLFFTDVKFFKTGEWVLGFPLLVLSWRVWVRENQDEPLAFIRQPHHTIVWDKENQYKAQVLTNICENRNKPSIGLIRKRHHCSICGMENRNKSPAFTIRQQNQSCIWDGENKKKPVFFIRHSRHCSFCDRENQNKPLIIIRKPHPSKTRIRSKET